MSARRAQNKGHGFKKGASSSNPDRIATKAGMRDRSTINRLRMYKHSGPIRNRDGKIVGGDFMMKDRTGNKKVTGATGRVAPNRRWFGNTRVIGQAELDQFREAMTEAVHDPYVASLRALGSHCPGSHHANPSHRVWVLLALGSIVAQILRRASPAQAPDGAALRAQAGEAYELAEH